MPYKVMALKWRPQTFQEVVGQDPVIKTLQNAITSGRIGHAYLFSGSRGVGKTTVARILAKALNCQKGPTPAPCNECTSCREIAEDRNLDVLEIDGASNRGIDDIRELRERVQYSPVSCKYKVIIIDEVHQLTDAAFNALLKILEEPPAHVIFIFATTEPQKLPLTILSRCQRFDFHRIPSKQIVGRLAHIAEHDHIQVEEGALAIIARRADGSMRDGQSLLEQVLSYGGEQITEELASEALGLASRDVFFELLDAVHDRDTGAVLDLVAAVEEQGWDMEDFVTGLLDHLRSLLLVKIDPQSSGPIGLSRADGKRMQEQGTRVQEEDLLRMMSLTSEIQKDLKYASRPRFLLEMLAIKLAKMDTTVQLKELMQDLNRMLGGQSRESKGPGADAPTIQMEPEPPQAAPSPPEREAPKSPAAAQPAPPLPEAQGQTRDLWDQMLDRVTKKKSSLGALLQHGQLGEVEERSMTISFPKSCAFHRERAQAQKNREVIEGEASALLGKDVRIKFAMADIPEPPRRLGLSAEPAVKKPSKEDIIKAEPTVNMILEKLDGEIID